VRHAGYDIRPGSENGGGLGRTAQRQSSMVVEVPSRELVAAVLALRAGRRPTRSDTPLVDQVHPESLGHE
jgi:hypothetical protein